LEYLFLVPILVLAAIAVWLAIRRPDPEDEVPGSIDRSDEGAAQTASGAGAATSVAAASADQALVSRVGTTEVADMQPDITSTPGTAPTTPGDGSTPPRYESAAELAPSIETPRGSSTPTYGASTSAYTPAWDQETQRGTLPMQILGVGAGTLAMVGTAVGGALLYRRWQRERNRPINRLRRQAQGVARQVGQRLPDRHLIEERLPEPEVAAPVGGVGTALLVGGLVAAQMLRRRREQSAMEQAAQMAQDSIENARDTWPQSMEALLRRVGEMSLPSPSPDRMRHMAEAGVTRLEPATKPAGIGLGGLLALGAAGYLAWRAINRQDQTPKGWRPAAARGEVSPE
jgi:hypothetical protein